MKTVWPRVLTVVGVLAFVLIPLNLFMARTFSSKAQLRMLFWHPQGTPNVPADLTSESGAVRVLKSFTVYQRVSKRIPWELSEADYYRSLILTSNRHKWSPTGGIYMQLSAVSNTPERSKQLCQIASEEFSGRCQELSMELDQAFWDLQTARAHGALEQWRFQHKVPSELELQARARKMRRRLSITIAAAQMRLSHMRNGDDPNSVKLSERTQVLVTRLKEVEVILDTMWVKGVSDERVVDLEIEVKEGRLQLQESVRADQSAALHRLESELADLQKREVQVSEQTVAQAIDDLEELREAMSAVAQAREFSLGQMSMFCLVVRRPEEGVLQAATLWELTPALLSTLVCLVCGLGRRKVAV
jgi:hypothetical protein